MFFDMLFPDKSNRDMRSNASAPKFFKDLNLDQVFAPILKRTKKYCIEKAFFTPLEDAGVIAYRQETLKELEDDTLREIVSSFSSSLFEVQDRMQSMNEVLLLQKQHKSNYLVCGRLLDCAEDYQRIIEGTADYLEARMPESRSLKGLAEYLSIYRSTKWFSRFKMHIESLRRKLSKVEYCMLVKDGTIRIRKYDGQPDLSEQVIQTFEKFRQGETNDYRHSYSEAPYAEHVEAAVLSLVAGLYENEFAELDRFCAEYSGFQDETIMRVSREAQFYLSWLEYIEPLQNAGLPFNCPSIEATPDHLLGVGVFDIALACAKQGKVVSNDFELDDPERIIVVTGPNQGGKTTFARCFGQMHYLASLGLSVPGRKSLLFLPDRILTHFGKEEDSSSPNGRLQDDLERLHELIEEATERSVVIVNEIFSSTTLADALDLGGRMMDVIEAIKATGVVVTFLDELASHGPETVSMMSIIEQGNPYRRTFKIIRKPPDGLAYAKCLAELHDLTYEKLLERIAER